MSQTDSMLWVNQAPIHNFRVRTSMYVPEVHFRVLSSTISEQECPCHFADRKLVAGAARLMDSLSVGQFVSLRQDHRGHARPTDGHHDYQSASMLSPIQLQEVTGQHVLE